MDRETLSHLDLGLLASSPFYLVKRPIHRRVACWGPRLAGRVLDVGCGSRPFRKYLTSCQQYVGLERNAGLVPDLVGSALALPLADKSADHAICLEVLEHLPEPELALREMSRVLADGGLLILSTPMTWYLHYEPHDYYRFTGYGLHYLLEKTGFQPLYQDRKGGYWTVVLSRAVEVCFQFAYRLTVPIRWLTGRDRGRFRAAVLGILPIQALALVAQALLESANSPYVQGWVVLARKKPMRGQDASDAARTS